MSTIEKLIVAILVMLFVVIGFQAEQYIVLKQIEIHLRK